MTDEELNELVHALEARANRMNDLGSSRGALLADAASAIRQLMRERDEARRMYDFAMDEAKTIASIFLRHPPAPS